MKLIFVSNNHPPLTENRIKFEDFNFWLEAVKYKLKTSRLELFLDKIINLSLEERHTKKKKNVKARERCERV